MQELRVRSKNLLTLTKYDTVSGAEVLILSNIDFTIPPVSY
jgi:hypothetical protein